MFPMISIHASQRLVSLIFTLEMNARDAKAFVKVTNEVSTKTGLAERNSSGRAGGVLFGNSFHPCIRADLVLASESSRRV